MRWIMVLVKDQFTGLCYLRAIPNKNAKFVCFELNSLFGLIRYPHIFHTDNGSEFTAEQVVGMLKRWNQTILTVTGRPRKPSDQGSVEIINRLVKRVMNSVLASEVQKGNLRPNWGTKYLGEDNSIQNRQCGWARNHDVVSAYETVLGLFLISLCQTPGTASAGAQLYKSAWMWQLAVDSVLLWNPCMN